MTLVGFGCADPLGRAFRISSDTRSAVTLAPVLAFLTENCGLRCVTSIDTPAAVVGWFSPALRAAPAALRAAVAALGSSNLLSYS